MKLVAFTDGASRGNPGESGIGILLKSTDGSVVRSLNGCIGVTTNNVAEYTALLACLHAVFELNCTELAVHSDSELMVRQMNGQYKVKDADLKILHKKATNLIARSRIRFSISHIDRSKNAEADQLANEAIDQKIPLAGIVSGEVVQENLFH
jgi:ribonuclease HI